MAFIKEEEKWEDNLYEIATTDPVQGGTDGIDNLPHKVLGNRTKFLKKSFEDIKNTISMLSNKYLSKNETAVNSLKLNNQSADYYAKKDGNENNTFKVAKAVNTNDAVNLEYFNDKKNYNDEWRYKRIDLTNEDPNKAYPLVFQFGSGIRQGISEILIKRHYPDDGKSTKIFAEQNDPVHVASLYLHIVGNDVSWGGNPQISEIKYHDWVYVPTVLRYDYRGYLTKEEYKEGSTWRNKPPNHSPTYQIIYLRGGVSYKVNFKNLEERLDGVLKTKEPYIFTKETIILHSTSGDDLDYKQYVAPIPWDTSKALTKRDTSKSFFPLSIYKTIQLKERSPINLDLGLSREGFKAVVGAVYLAANAKRTDHFNLNIGKSSNSNITKETWGDWSFPRQTPAEYITPITHMGDSQQVMTGAYGVWIPFTAVLNGDGSLHMSVIGASGNPYFSFVAIKIIGGLR